MAAPDRSPLRRRLAWFAGSLLLLGALAAAFWLGRPPSPPPAPAVAPAPAAPAIASAPAAPEALGLADLAAAVEAAQRSPLEPASGPRAPSILGRRFSVALPFGCAGPLPEEAEAPLGYSHDAGQGTITLAARPQDWTRAGLVQATSGGEAFEAVEGFWVRPSPAASQGCGEAASAPGPRIGLAAFFPPGASRTAQRRSRPWRVTRKLAGPPPSFPQGFRLVLSGRVDEGEDAPAIRCALVQAGAPPECLIAVSFDRIAFQDAASGETLAAWDS